MKKINLAIWLILGLLSLAMGALLYVRFSPRMLVKVIGKNGREGQLGKICSCNQNLVLLEEIIDNDTGIGVEGGAGFTVQLKKLVVINLEQAEIIKIGLSINTVLLGCNQKTIWIFEPGKGVTGLSTENGRLIVDQSELLNKNPYLIDKLSGTASDFSLSSDKQELVIADIEGKFWSLDNRFKAYRLTKKTEPGHYAEQASNQHPFEAWGLFYPLKLCDANTGREIHTETGALIFHQKNKLKEGLRLSLIVAGGKTTWTKNFDQLLDRKNEKCRPAATYQIGNRVMLILDTNRGTRLIWLELKSGKLLKNLSV